MRILIGLISLLLLSGCAVFNPNPMTPYNGVYRDTELMEKEKSYVLDLGDETIIVESEWSKNTRRPSKHYQPNTYNISTKYYRYEDGQLHEIKKAE